MMKKRILVAILLLILVLAIVSAVLVVCNPHIRNMLGLSHDPQPDTEPEKTEELSTVSTAAPDETSEPETEPEETVEETSAPSRVYEPLNIPVYSEEELLFGEDRFFALNHDACHDYYSDSSPNFREYILRDFPTKAFRVRTRWPLYAVYDTDQGSRLYLFFGYDIPTLIGFPILINEVHSLKDFQTIAVGDTIDDVAAIDDVTELYKHEFYEVIWKNKEELYIVTKNAESRRHPRSTIHYLEEGILKIEYEMQEDLTLVVSKIIFNEDYILVNKDGRMVCYKIEEIDLPTNEAA